MAATTAKKQLRQADSLDQAIDNYENLINDSSNALDTLAVRLLDLCKFTTQIQNKSASINQASLNIAAVKANTQQLLECLTVSKKLHDRIQQGCGKDLDGYLESLRVLEKAVNYLQANNSLACAQQALSHSKMVMDKAMHSCHMEFANVLTDNSKTFSAPWLQNAATKPASDFGAVELELVARAAFPRLPKLAKTMLRAQFRECAEIYIQIREKLFDKLMSSVGLEMVPLATLQAMQFAPLESKIQAWVVQLRVFTILALKEKLLADSILMPPFNNQVYTEIVGHSFSILMQLGKDITETKRVPEKVFPLLDMYHHISEITPILEQGLKHKEARDMLSELQGLSATISKMARVIFAEFEDMVARDQSPWDVPDGTVHPLCAQVLSFMKQLFTYRNASEVLFREVVGAGGGDTVTAEKHGMSVGIMRILMVLLENLQVKAATYKNKALQNIFLMNNIHYMVWTVEQCMALELLGQDWVERHKDFVESYGAAYHDLTWAPLVKIIQVDDLDAFSSRSISVAKERCKAFNAGWDAVYSAQCSWSIPDLQLKLAVKHFIYQDLVSVYQKFHSKMLTILETHGVSSSKYVKYTADELQNLVQQNLLENRQLSLRGK